MTALPMGTFSTGVRRRSYCLPAFQPLQLMFGAQGAKAVLKTHKQNQPKINK